MLWHDDDNAITLPVYLFFNAFYIKENKVMADMYILFHAVISLENVYLF